jgi:hypothetical protein
MLFFFPGEQFVKYSQAHLAGASFSRLEKGLDLGYHLAPVVFTVKRLQKHGNQLLFVIDLVDKA